MTKSALTSKFFRIGTSGPTVDGREIDPQDIDDMADAYSVDEYTASINVEHIKSLSSFGAFPALGRVIKLKAETDAKGRRVLLAQIEPSTELLYVNSQKQKLFTSMEVAKNFAKTGKAYLVGLAVTDSPASLGVEALCFSAKNNGPAEDRFKNNLFTPNYETDQFAMKTKSDTAKPDASKPEGDDKPDDKQTFAQKFAAMFKPAQESADANDTVIKDAMLQLAGKFTELEAEFTSVKKDNADLTEKVTAQAEEIEKLSAALESEPEGGGQRPPATGGNENLTEF